MSQKNIILITAMIILALICIGFAYHKEKKLAQEEMRYRLNTTPMNVK